MPNKVISRGELAYILGKSTLRDEMHWYKKIGKDIKENIIVPEKNSGNCFFSLEEVKKYLEHVNYEERIQGKDQKMERIRDVLKLQSILTQEEMIQNIKEIIG